MASLDGDSVFSNVPVEETIKVCIEKDFKDNIFVLFPK